MPDDALLAAAGDLRRAYQEVDWAATPVGPAASWSPALRSALDLALNTRFPVTLFWGPEFVLLYNEAYVPVLAEKHPNALGRRAVDVFPEAWDTIGPWMQAVLDGEGAVWIEDAPVPLLRHGRLQESYFTFCYSPVRAVDGRVEGVIDIVAETTRNVIDQRRLGMLGRLREVLAGAEVVGDAFAAALGVLRENAGDMPAVDIVVGEPGFFGRDDLRLPLGEGRVLRVSLSEHLAHDETYFGFLRLAAAAIDQAVDRIRAREAEDAVAEALQRSLLTDPPSVDGHVDRRALPAGGGAGAGRRGLVRRVPRAGRAAERGGGRRHRARPDLGRRDGPAPQRPARGGVDVGGRVAGRRVARAGPRRGRARGGDLRDRAARARV